MELYLVASLCGTISVVFLVGVLCDVTTGRFKQSGIGTLYLQASNVIDEIHTDNEMLCAQACLQSSCAAFMYRETDTVIVHDHCHDSATAHGYSGRINTTASGKTCQRWDSFNFTAQDFENDTSLEEAKNYCRSPDFDTFVWCFTTDPAVHWEYCDVVKCMDVQYNCRLYNMTTTPYRTINGFKYFVRDRPN